MTIMQLQGLLLLLLVIMYELYLYLIPRTKREYPLLVWLKWFILLVAIPLALVTG